MSRHARRAAARRVKHAHQSKAHPHRGRRLLALFTALAVPAVAATPGWNALATPENDQGVRKIRPAIQPVEDPAQNFPGSAFYFLEQQPGYVHSADAATAALFDMSGTGDIKASERLAASRAGPAARAFTGTGNGLSMMRAQNCMTKAIYYEAASEAVGGQRAVAQVVLNRVAHPSYPNSVCGVVFQGSERTTGCQFSFTCDGSLRRQPSAKGWARAGKVAREALAGRVYKPVGLATHYHTVWIYPYWAPSLTHIGTIGAHRFYRWRGAAGKPGAFTARYAGAEPVAAPNPRSDTSSAPDLADPVALARAFEEARIKAGEQAGQLKQDLIPARMPQPAYSREVAERGGDSLYTADNLPGSSGVKAEYANSGRWLDKPGELRVRPGHLQPNSPKANVSGQDAAQNTPQNTAQNTPQNTGTNTAGK